MNNSANSLKSDVISDLELKKESLDFEEEEGTIETKQELKTEL